MHELKPQPVGSRSRQDLRDVGAELVILSKELEPRRDPIQSQMVEEDLPQYMPEPQYLRVSSNVATDNANANATTGASCLSAYMSEPEWHEPNPRSYLITDADFNALTGVPLAPMDARHHD